MDYNKIYTKLCEKSKGRGLQKQVGFEVHHIVPRCLNGTDYDDNLVKLTLKEHLLAHKLLTKIYPDNIKLKLAVFLMEGMRNKYSTSYDKLRESWPETLREWYSKNSISLGKGIHLPNISNYKIGYRLSREDIDIIKSLIEDLGLNVTSSRITSSSSLWKFLNFCVQEGTDYIRVLPKCTSYHKRLLKLLERHGKLVRVKESKTLIYLINKDELKNYLYEQDCYITIINYEERLLNKNTRKRLDEKGLFISQDITDSKKHYILPWIISSESLDDLGDLAYKPRNITGIKDEINKMFNKNNR